MNTLPIVHVDGCQETGNNKQMFRTFILPKRSISLHK